MPNHARIKSHSKVDRNERGSGFYKLNYRQLSGVLTAIGSFLVILFFLPASFDDPARKMIAIVTSGVVLWIFEALPLGLTAAVIMLFMLLLQPVSIEVIYSGFSSSAIFLIIGGMMLARAVNETSLARRITFNILAKWGGTSKGLLGCILIIPQVQSFFIPAAAVRTTLLLPIAIDVLDTIGAPAHSNLRKKVLLGVAFGGTISGTAVMTAAIGNILTVNLLKQFLGVEITYFEWFIYSLPLWITLIPGAWIVLLKCYPLKKEDQSFPKVKNEMQEKVREFGPLNSKEKKCLLILTVTVLLWMTEPLHGLDLSIPAIMGVVLMTLPGVGCASWSNVVKINYDTIFLLGATLSMGYALTESGAAEQIGKVMATPWILSLIQVPIYAVIFILIASQVFHLIMSNVSTAVVTLIPIYIGMSLEAGIDPTFVCFTAALTCLHGYILVVETMPNVIVHSSGQISQREFLVPGLYMTLLMMGLTILIAFTWWDWVGLVP
ncbi:DASS family sodium-coupled anion symporter [Halobacillus shinanisalinarum]|uniref:Sodium-dependent dicarboxylate transporter SdcS n=1 Tax=Halobacillus shinanisalinarum TaxID=2932258 RepID=A0ABY4H5N1_9BACI|nr:DASS family sodium-coupled anion symporter [Halobacillus shinanisalinarum]UOQ94892.1 DASS family sodium-coupled anion symporter [Halobacillus shinanisalinarum]